ncbi:MAG: hypothetical protein HZC24_04005 [Rhodocyclales bacterium]|nr:hypothetical protein [Rhodocyclales bacterium]
MLCLQQCVDLCEFSTEEAEALRNRATLAEILAIQAECPHYKGIAAEQLAESVAGCGMLDLRDVLLAELGAAEDFEDLERVVHHYCEYAAARDSDIADAA